MTLYERLFPSGSGCGLWLLLDPDKAPPDQLADTARSAEEDGASVILVGGSFIAHDGFDTAVKAVKAAVSIPVVLFPGSSRQVSRYADGMLFTSLLSGRNPQFLIGEQLMAAPLIIQMGLPVIPTAYLLIESGGMTSAEFVSDTKPLPRDKPHLALAHAQAAFLLGMKAVYLEAGSGARFPVPVEMIRMVAKGIFLPVIVGGGIAAPEQAAAAAAAGARAIVVGTAVEREGVKILHEMVKALESQVNLNNL
ncbi:MAG: geranylgeranylglyceryl/heptaprenylglyceryl phosphate synthase [Calditrichota bacterium]